jgi:hypothetical protein
MVSLSKSGNIICKMSWMSRDLYARIYCNSLFPYRFRRCLGSGVETGTSSHRDSSLTRTTRGSKLCIQREGTTGIYRLNTCRNVTTARTSVRWVAFSVPWCQQTTTAGKSVKRVKFSVVMPTKRLRHYESQMSNVQWHNAHNATACHTSARWV